MEANHSRGMNCGGFVESFLMVWRVCGGVASIHCRVHNDPVTLLKKPPCQAVFLCLHFRGWEAR